MKKDYICQLCNKQYNCTKSNYNTHVRRCKAKQERLKNKQPKVYSCEDCDYTTSNKSNLNKHVRRVHVGMKDSYTREKLITKIISLKGSINRYEGRSTSNNEAVKLEAIERLEVCRKEYDIYSQLYKRHFLNIKNGNEQNVKIKKNIKHKRMDIDDDMIKRINESYEDKLNFTMQNITNINKNDDEINIYVNLTVDDDEPIDLIKLVKDNILDAYKAFLMQDTDYGMQEYESFYVY